MGTPAGSLIMGGINEILKTNRNGLTVPLTSPEQLRTFLLHIKHKELDRKFVEQQQGADSRIMQLCIEILKQTARRND